MNTLHSVRLSGRHWLPALCLFVWAAETTNCSATVLELKNGMRVSGIHTKIASLGNDLFGGGAGGVNVKPIFMVDDGLRRVFFSRYQLANAYDEIESFEHIRLEQPVSKRGTLVGSVGSLLKTPGPFDEWGRRTVTISSSKGPLEVVQGVTEITPIYTRVQALNSFNWDMRVATSSIPRTTLSQILKNHVKQDDNNQRLSVVRLYLQSERYDDAAEELKSVIADFPELDDLQDQLDSLERLFAEQKISIIRRRRSAGQHALVWSLLNSVGTDDVPAESLLVIRELHEEYEKNIEKIDNHLQRVDALTESLADGALQVMMRQFADELRRELSVNTIDRLADFERLADDTSLNSEQHLALAVSGWLLDGGGKDNLALATSLWRTRDVIRRYLVAESPAERQTLLQEIGSEEAYAPQHVARLLAAMPPPMAPLPPELPQQQDTAPTRASGKEPQDVTPSKGLFEFRVAGIDEDEFRYIVQLPPEYDPHRKYPTVVTLHSSGTSPELQVDWWAGPHSSDHKMRMGQAARFGYIVVAPQWATDGQKKYHYSAREHAAVMFCLRDAMQRFSIDSDRVFLSGYSLGGDAAWDIGLSHPDVWAGVIPIAATAVYPGKQSPKYVSLYWLNARHVPFYFVQGDKDGARLKLNSRDLNRYLTRDGIDAMVVEYMGRGHESFQDEVQNIFEWMNLHRRPFDIKQFEVVTLRPWDNFFWWTEVSDLPARSTALPYAWPSKGAPRPVTIKGLVNDRKNVQVNTGTGGVTVMLTPSLVDFDNGVTIYVNGKARKRGVTADTEVMLEDARRRGDRQRPFWSKTETTTRRRTR